MFVINPIGRTRRTVGCTVSSCRSELLYLLVGFQCWYSAKTIL